MEILLKKRTNSTTFEATNDTGNTILIDGLSDAAMSPMQILLSSVAGCTVVDIQLILEKQREPLEDIEIKISGERVDSKVVKPFKSIHIHFVLKGALNEDKVSRAISLSVEKYCSVATSLDKNIDITYSHEIVA